MRYPRLRLRSVPRFQPTRLPAVSRLGVGPAKPPRFLHGPVRACHGRLPRRVGLVRPGETLRHLRKIGRQTRSSATPDTGSAPLVLGGRPASGHWSTWRSGGKAPFTVSECSSDDPRRWHRSPVAAVVGFAAVIPHQKPVSGRHADRRRELALRAVAARTKVGAVFRHEQPQTVRPPIYATSSNIDLVTRPGDDTLYQADLRLTRVGCRARRYTTLDNMRTRSTLLRGIAFGRVIYDDIAHTGCPFLYDHTRSDSQGRFHRS
jgi:hypothetical protein